MPSHSIDSTTFATLLRRWNRHQDLRRAGASVPELAASRIALDAARDDLRTAA